MNCRNCGAPVPSDGKCEYCGSFYKEAVHNTPPEEKDDSCRCPNCGGSPIVLTDNDVHYLTWDVVVKCDGCGQTTGIYKVDKTGGLDEENFRFKQMNAISKALIDFKNGQFEGPTVSHLYADGQLMATVPDAVTSMINNGILTPSAYRDMILKPKEWIPNAGIIPKNLRQFQRYPTEYEIAEINQIISTAWILPEDFKQLIDRGDT